MDRGSGLEPNLGQAAQDTAQSLEEWDGRELGHHGWQQGWDRQSCQQLLYLFLSRLQVTHGGESWRWDTHTQCTQ